MTTTWLNSSTVYPGRSDSLSRSMENHGRGRIGHAGMGFLVLPSLTAGPNRIYSTDVSLINRAFTEPGAVRLTDEQG